MIYFETKRSKEGHRVVEKLYTVSEVLNMLRISRATLYRHIDSGLIKPLKLGGKVLFTESEISGLIERLQRKE